MQGSGVSQGQKNFPFSNIQQYEFFDDFENITNWTLFNNAGAGIGTVTYENDTIVNLNTGTPLNNTVGLQRYLNAINSGNTSISSPLYFKSRIKVNSLIGCNIAIGFGNRNIRTNGSFTNGFCFNLSIGSSPNFRIISSSNSIDTILTTNIVVVVNTFYVLECYYAVSNINYFINGIFVGTISTNIPSVSLTPSIVAVNGNLGTTFVLSPDYWYHRQRFNINRG